MLPDFLLTVGNSMQDLSCDDFSLMNGGNVSTTPAAIPATTTTTLRTEFLYPNTTTNKTSNNNNNTNNSSTNINTASTNITNHSPTTKFDVSLLRGIKLEDAQGGGCNERELIEVNSDAAPMVWRQMHSMFSTDNESVIHQPQHQPKQPQQQQQQLLIQQNNHQQQHQYQSPHTRRSQHHHHQNHHQRQHPHQHQHHPHRQLLLQSSDDPLICHGADSVVNDDDQSVELKHLLTAASNGHQQQHQHHQPQPKQLSSVQSMPQSKLMMATNGPPTTNVATKRPQNGCSSLTKQQLKVKAGLMSAAQQQQQQQQQQQRQEPSTVQSAAKPPKTKSKKKSTTSGGGGCNIPSNGSGAVKLRFHHQALPPEYLNHYKATQRQTAPHTTKDPTVQGGNGHSPPATTAVATPVKACQTAKLPPPKSSHENVRSWLQKIAEIQRAAQQQQQQQQPHPQPPPQHSSRANKNLAPALQSTPTATATAAGPPNDANNNHQTCRMSGAHSPLLSAAPYECPAAKPATAANTAMAPIAAASSSSRVLKFADLPYMGEITLNNSKPRRGRKPKKADICHLIYKNYGTIFSGASKPPHSVEQASDGAAVQRKTKTLPPEAACSEEQPLNLCLRDYQSLELYSVSSGDGNGDGDADDGAGDFNEAVSDSCDSHSKCTTPGDALTDAMLATNMKAAMPSLEAGEASSHTPKVLPVKAERPEHVELETQAESNMLHPARAYYQKLLESGVLVRQRDGSTSTFAGLPIETIEKDNQIALKIPIPSGLFVIPKMEGKPPVEYPEPLSTPSSIKSEQSFTTTNSSTVTNSNSGAAPQKRKRSAIFIPPMPADSATNPANEVSICKFKFTGGAKPSLQEKKMLSVDSDGNYRYYSGTGDKSMRGYEFFPRESLQQSGFLPGVGGAGAFLNATGEKILIDIPPPSAELSNELLQIPDSPTGPLLLPSTGGVAAVLDAPLLTNGRNPGPVPLLLATQLSPNTFRHKRSAQQGAAGAVEPGVVSLGTPANDVNASVQHHRKKKLSSRRSSQREKLERTFKEKGFLIQTQQLESAEGATYCKFRQLKKFTRYLFRNWKDYLPDGQAQLQPVDGADSQQATAAIERLLIGHEFDGVKPMPPMGELKKMAIVSSARQQGINEASTDAEMGVEQS